MKQRLNFAVLCIAACVAMGGCAQKGGVRSDQDGGSLSTDGGVHAARDSDHDRAHGLRTVLFAYDSPVLDSEGKKILKENAAILRSKGTLRVQIEGHCDSRGGVQYNLALGEKRASAVRKYLVGLGIPLRQMEIISYGKERLLDQADTDAAHARNRRANFVIVRD